MKSSRVKRFIQWMIALAIIFVLVVLAMGGFQQISFWVRSHGVMSKMVQKGNQNILKDAGEIILEGDLNQEGGKRLIYADGKWIGTMTETEEYESYQFQFGDGEEFRMEPYNEGPLREGLDTADGYIFYNGDGEIVGYAQETLRTLPSKEKRYVYILYDGEDGVSRYYLDTERNEIGTIQGILLIKGSKTYNRFNHISTAKLVCKDDGEVDNLHKLLFAACMEKESYQENMDKGDLYGTKER